MTILVTADWHLNDLPRDAYRHKFMEWLIDQVKLLRITKVIVLGDLTEEKTNHGAWLVNAISQYINDISMEADVIILTGNHDYVSEDVPFFEFTKHMEHVWWINRPTLRDECLFLPHTNNYKKANWPLKDKYDFIFSHQTFQGADVGARKLDGIPLSIFRKDARIISGDIHVPQTIGNLTYVGAPYHVDFGDNYQGRVLLIDGDKVKSIPYDGPQKRLIEVKSFSDIKSLGKTGARKGDILKFRINVKQSQYDEWDAIKTDIRRWGDDNGYNIEIVQPAVQMLPKTQIKQSSAKDDKALLEAFVKRVDAPKETLNTGMGML